MEEFEEVTPESAPDAEVQNGSNIGTIIGIAVAAIVVLAVLGLAAYGLVALVTQPTRQASIIMAVLRDVSIIVLALVTIVIGTLLAVLIFQLQGLTVLLRDEIQPILESANETASTVRGTTTFVSDAVVTPVITAASYVEAIRQTVKVLAGNPSRGRQRAQRASEQQSTNEKNIKE